MPATTRRDAWRADASLGAAGRAGSGVVFRAGEGVGTVTRPGLPIPPGEPAINPVPRRMIAAALAEVEAVPDVEVTIGIDDGEARASAR
jgi:cobalt-precorrin-5B (C1)-methyltransferase